MISRKSDKLFFSLNFAKLMAKHLRSHELIQGKRKISSVVSISKAEQTGIIFPRFPHEIKRVHVLSSNTLAERFVYRTGTELFFTLALTQIHFQQEGRDVSPI